VILIALTPKHHPGRIGLAVRVWARRAELAVEVRVHVRARAGQPTRADGVLDRGKSRESGGLAYPSGGHGTVDATIVSPRTALNARRPWQ